jgi:acetyl-CoA acetyltransferase
VHRLQLSLTYLQHVIARSGVPPAEVQDICVGNVGASGTCYQARTAALVSGFPE